MQISSCRLTALLISFTICLTLGLTGNKPLSVVALEPNTGASKELPSPIAVIVLMMLGLGVSNCTILIRGVVRCFVGKEGSALIKTKTVFLLISLTIVPICLTAFGLDVSFVFSLNLSLYIFLKMFLTTLQVFSSHEGTKEFFLNDHPKISQIIQKSQQFAETVLQKIINCIAFKFKFNRVAPLQEDDSCV